MTTPDRIPHFTDPQFSGVRGELARLFIAHKTDIGLADRANADIEAQLDDIAWTLVQRVALAEHLSDAAFLQRFGWLVEVFQRLDQGERSPSQS